MSLSISAPASASAHLAQTTQATQTASNNQVHSERTEAREHDSDQDSSRAVSQTSQVKTNRVAVASGTLGNHINTHA